MLTACEIPIENVILGWVLLVPTNVNDFVNTCI